MLLKYLQVSLPNTYFVSIYKFSSFIFISPFPPPPPRVKGTETIESNDRGLTGINNDIKDLKCDSDCGGPILLLCWIFCCTGNI